MFSCTACLRRAIYSLTSDLPLPLSLSAPVLQTRSQSLSTTSPPRKRHLLSHTRTRDTSSSRLVQNHDQKRTHATAQSIRKGHHQRDIRKALDPKAPQPVPKNVRHGIVSKVAQRDVRARQTNRGLLDKTDTQSKDEWRVQNYLKDPLKLAGAVLERLRGGDAAGALELVRASEKVPASTFSDGAEGKRLVAVENVVSWNHLIDWHMHNGDARGAHKIYNELKKRGHKPDAHTYTIMLRGFADPKNVRKPNAVKDAVAVYNSIFAANSAVVANTIHTNAIVNVCARGGDMDALWAVTGRLAERGVGSPDKWTFTTVLNAMRADAVSRAAKVASDEGGEAAVSKVFEGAVNDGRKLWEDVVRRWRSGDVLVDEPLVCAMGRLLLISLERKDWRDVGALVEQTMGIGSLMGVEDHSGSHELEDTKDEGIVDALSSLELTPVESGRSTAATNEFAPVVRPETNASSKVANTNTSIYAAPGNNTLSLLVEAATLLKSPGAGKAYWDLLTKPDGAHNIQPDAQNLTAYLRLLRISRSSKLARELLRGDFGEAVEGDFFKRGTFVIAMSTCVRDKRNPNVFDYASGILDVMQEKLPSQNVEPKVLAMYIELAVGTTPGLERGTRETFVPDLRRNNVMRMLGRLRPDVLNIRQLIKMKIDEVEYEKLPTHVRKRRERYAPLKVPGSGLEDLAGVLRGLVGACDRIVAVAGDGADNNGRIRFSGGMSEREWAEFVEEVKGQKRKLAAFLTKMIGTPPPGPRWDNTASIGNSREDLAAGNEEEITDEEAQKSVPGKRKVYRALQEGAAEYEKLPRAYTQREVRREREEKRVERIRGQFPRSSLKPLPRREVRVRQRGERSGYAGRDGDGERVRESGLVSRGWGGFGSMAEGTGRGGNGREGDFVEL